MLAEIEIGGWIIFQKSIAGAEGGLEEINFLNFRFGNGSLNNNIT